MMLFGGRITQPAGGGDSAEEELTTNEAAEIIAASKAATAAEEQRVLLQQLQKRKEALMRQVDVLTATSSPAVDMVFSDPLAEPKAQPPSTTKRRKYSAKSSKPPREKKHVNKPMDQLPILTTSGDLPFEVGLHGSDGQEHGQEITRLMPVFLLPEVSSTARFIRRIPKEDTIAEAAARKEEAEELMAMKRALNLGDEDLLELEEELKDMARRKAMEQDCQEEESGLDPVRDAMAIDSSYKLPPIPITKEKHLPPEVRVTPRSLRARGIRNPESMRDDLISSLSSYEAFAAAVKRDIANIQMSGVPISHPRAAKHMQKWGATKMWGAITRLWRSLLGAVVYRWRWAVKQMKLSERRRAYRNYQGGRLLVNFMRNYMLKFAAIAWVRWWNLVLEQRAAEERIRRYNAATKIQAQWRARAARDATRALRAVLEKKRRSRAATKIQRWYEGCRMRWAYNAMVRAKIQKAAAILIETRARMLLAKSKVAIQIHERDKLNAAILLQSFWRGRVGRLIANWIKIEKLEVRSANKIQAVARGRMGRLKVMRIRRAKIENQAALIIQSRARGIASRLRCIKIRQERAKQRAQMSAAALLVQKTYRGHRDRLKTQILMNGIRQRRILEDRMAVYVQAAVRGLLCRKKIKMMREERDEELLLDARKFVETAQEGGGVFYLNVETGESEMTAPSSGYTKQDGMLVLSTGKVIEDPFTNMTPEEKKAKMLEKKCSECEDRNATRKCDQCGDKYCATCYEDTHTTGARKYHIWQRLGHIECVECEGVPKAAVRWCIVCDDPFCALHWDDLHRRGARSMHPFCSIDSSGSIDYEALNAYGEKQGRFTVGPLTKGGGDDGLGNMSVVQEEEEEKEEETQYDGEAAQEGEVKGGDWAVFSDEAGVEYWYNNETGETSYEDPNQVKAPKDNTEWTEFTDNEGNLYWHNNTTGDSTYDSPFSP